MGGSTCAEVRERDAPTTVGGTVSFLGPPLVLSANAVRAVLEGLPCRVVYCVECLCDVRRCDSDADVFVVGLVGEANDGGPPPRETPPLGHPAGGPASIGPRPCYDRPRNPARRSGRTRHPLAPPGGGVGAAAPLAARSGGTPLARSVRDA